MEMGRFIKLFLDRKALSLKCARPVLPDDAGGARTSVVSTRCEVHDLSRKDRAKVLIVSSDRRTLARCDVRTGVPVALVQ